VVMIGGGILILLIIRGSLTAGGILNNLGSGFSKALASSADVNLGPLHKSASAAGAVNANVGCGATVLCGRRTLAPSQNNNSFKTML
jgi:hypothetical protein